MHARGASLSRSGTPLGTLRPGLSSGLPHRGPSSTHLQSEVDGGEQAFAGWAGEVPPAEGVPELGRYATETGEMASGGKRVGPRRGPESWGAEQGERQRHPEEPRAGRAADPAGSLLPAGPGVASAGSYSQGAHCHPGWSPVPAPPVQAPAGLRALGTRAGDSQLAQQQLADSSANKLHNSSTPSSSSRPISCPPRGGEPSLRRRGAWAGRALDTPSAPPRVPRPRAAARVAGAGPSAPRLSEPALEFPARPPARPSPRSLGARGAGQGFSRGACCSRGDGASPRFPTLCPWRRHPASP